MGKNVLVKLLQNPFLEYVQVFQNYINFVGFWEVYDNILAWYFLNDSLEETLSSCF